MVDPPDHLINHALTRNLNTRVMHQAQQQCDHAVTRWLLCVKLHGSYDMHNVVDFRVMASAPVSTKHHECNVRFGYCFLAAAYSFNDGHESGAVPSPP